MTASVSPLNHGVYMCMCVRRGISKLQNAIAEYGSWPGALAKSSANTQVSTREL